MKYFLVIILSLAFGNAIFASPDSEPIPYRKGSKWGYVNKKKEFLIAPIYDDAERFHDRRAMVALGNKFGFINKKGKVLIPLMYDGVRRDNRFVNGYIAVKKGELYGIIDSNNRMVIPPVYDYVEVYIQDGKTVFGDSAGGGIINKKGEIERTPGKYFGRQDFYGGVAIIGSGPVDCGAMDANNKIIIPKIYFWITHLSKSILMAERNDSFFYFNHSGQRILTGLTREIKYPFYKGVSVYNYADGKDGLIDTNGKSIIARTFNLIGPINEGFGIFVDISMDDAKEGRDLNESVGLVTTTGKIILLPEIKKNVLPDAHCWFSEGASMVLDYEKGVFFIDTTGHRLNDQYYSNAGDFCEGRAAVTNGKVGYIDKSGKLVIPMKYDNPTLSSYFMDGLALVYLNGDWGYIDKEGNEYFEGVDEKNHPTESPFNDEH